MLCSDKQNAIYKLLGKYENDFNHAKAVCELALLLFEKTKDIHQIDEKYADMLFAASLLHDIGHCISSKEHHKESCNLILKKLEGFSAEEVNIIANIARYHKGSPPKDDHVSFSLLKDTKEKELVLKLTAILKIADGLDRPHNSTIYDFDVEYISNEKTLCLYAKSISENIDDVIESVKKKRDLYKKVFDIKVKVIKAD